MIVWIQEDTERDYSQREDRTNVLVVGNMEAMVKFSGDAFHGDTV
jgi:hypothetical protein